MSVNPDELTGTEQAVLLVLMAESRPVPNPELQRLGPDLKKPVRDRLNRLKLIKTMPGKPSMVHELTDDGWALCGKLFGADTPPKPSGQGKALYSVLRALRRHIDREDLQLSDVFLPPEDERPKVAAAEDGDLESRVRRTYSRLARRPGGWVALADLRANLAEVARSELDATLTRMYRIPGVSLIPEENQKTLTDADRDAAVEIGDQDKHLIAIDN